MSIEIICLLKQIHHVFFLVFEINILLQRLWIFEAT